MRILNLGAGAVRPPTPWVNLDSLYSILPVGTPERTQLDSEPNYVESDLRNPLPFPSDTFDGILASHIFEHFDALNLRPLIAQCHLALKPGGYLMSSVPDAAYHREVYDRDNKANCQELFGELLPATEAKQTFLEYALFFMDHRQVFTEDSLWATLVNGGFAGVNIERLDATERFKWAGDPVVSEMHSKLNRRMFSLVMIAKKIKPA